VAPSLVAAPTAATVSPTATPRSAATQRLLDGPILATLLRMAAPNMLLVLVQALSSAVDAFYLGRLGPAALAGIALVFPFWTLMVTTSAGALGGGISSSVARALGAGRRDTASALVVHSLLLASAAALAFSASMLLGGRLFFGAMGGSGAALDAALAYSTVVFSGALFVWLVNGLASLLRGSGEMLVPAVVVVAGELFHMALAPVLIFGLGPAPALGVLGGGLSLVTSYALRALALGAFVLARRAAVHLPAAPLRLQRHLFWDILRVGLPGSLNTLMSNLNVMAVTSLVGSSGVVALAGYGLAARLQFLLIPLVFGFGTALVTMVGTNVGAGQVRRARRVAWIGSGVAAAATGSIGLLVAIVPGVWLAWFTNEAAVLEVGSSYLRIVGPTFALFGLGLALYFSAQGAGRVAPALLAGFTSLLVSVGGGWLLIRWLHTDLAWLFGAIAAALVLFGGIQALAIDATIGSSFQRTTDQIRAANVRAD
jgi:putative MATE family efflux protein